MRADSSFFRLSTGVKLVWFISHTVIIFTSNFLILIVISICTTALYFIFCAYKSIYHRALLGSFILVGFLSVIMLIINPTLSGFVETIIFGSRWLLLTAVSIIFFTITSPAEIVFILEKVHLPKSIGLSLTASFRFIPIIMGEISRINFAQRARGLPEVSLSNFRVIPKVVRVTAIPLLISVANRSHYMYLAYELKTDSAMEKSKKRIFADLSVFDGFIFFYSAFIVIQTLFTVWLR